MPEVGIKTRVHQGANMGGVIANQARAFANAIGEELLKTQCHSAPSFGASKEGHVQKFHLPLATVG